jgi:hypothetical protein
LNEGSGSIMVYSPIVKFMAGCVWVYLPFSTLSHRPNPRPDLR